MRVRLISSILALTTLTLTSAASAHFELKLPKPSSTEMNGGKGGIPCGPDASSAVITEVMGGTMLPIEIDETTYHPGHYRVALAINSRDELDPAKPMGLKEPVVKGANDMVLNPAGPGDSVSGEIMNPVKFPVLADGLFPHTSDMGTFTGTVPIPNITCAKCTLQVIEFMAKHGPDYFYRHCADLKITADPGKPIFNPNGGAGGGGTGGGGAGGGGMAGTGGAAGGTGGAAGGTGGASGSATGGVPAVGGSPAGAAGTATAGTGTTGGGTTDDGSCSVARVGGQDAALASLAAGLLAGLAWLGRRRKRAS